MSSATLGFEAKGNIDSTAPVLCIGGDALTADFVNRLGARGVHGRLTASASEALRILACEDVVAVVVGPAMAASALPRLATIFARFVSLRPVPRWIALTEDDPELRKRQKASLPASALAQGARCLTASAALDWIVRRNPRREGRSAPARILNPSTLELLEADDLAYGEFLGLAWALYRRDARRFVDSLVQVWIEGDDVLVRQLAHKLVAVASGIGDVGTAAAARMIWVHDSSRLQEMQAVQSLPATLERALQSLELYLAGPGLCGVPG
jgi:hypothetical protein